MKVSIITPYKNSHNTFPSTYKSVINQTYEDFEWIIIDDGSSKEGFKKLIDIANDKRVSVYKNEGNFGPGGARNHGLKMVKGRFLTFLDSDDLWEENYLDKMTSLIFKSDGIIFSGYRRFDYTNKKYISDFIPSKKKITKNNILKGNPLSCLSTFIDTNKLQFLPEFGNYAARNDLVFFYKLLEQISYAKPINLVLGTYNLIPKSVSRNKFKALYFQWLVCRDIAKLSVFISIYNCICWAVYGVKKYYLND